MIVDEQPSTEQFIGLTAVSKDLSLTDHRKRFISDNFYGQNWLFNYKKHNKKIKVIIKFMLKH